MNSKVRVSRCTVWVVTVVIGSGVLGGWGAAGQVHEGIVAAPEHSDLGVQVEDGADVVAGEPEAVSAEMGVGGAPPPPPENSGSGEADIAGAAAGADDAYGPPSDPGDGGDAEDSEIENAVDLQSATLQANFDLFVETTKVPPTAQDTARAQVALWEAALRERGNAEALEAENIQPGDFDVIKKGHDVIASVESVGVGFDSEVVKSVQPIVSEITSFSDDAAEEAMKIVGENFVQGMQCLFFVEHAPGHMREAATFLDEATLHCQIPPGLELQQTPFSIIVGSEQAGYSDPMGLSLSSEVVSIVEERKASRGIGSLMILGVIISIVVLFRARLSQQQKRQNVSYLSAFREKSSTPLTPVQTIKNQSLRLRGRGNSPQHEATVDSNVTASVVENSGNGPMLRKGQGAAMPSPGTAALGGPSPGTVSGLSGAPLSTLPAMPLSASIPATPQTPPGLNPTGTPSIPYRSTAEGLPRAPSLGPAGGVEPATDEKRQS